MIKTIEKKLERCIKLLEVINSLHESWKNNGTGFYDLFVK